MSKEWTREEDEWLAAHYEKTDLKEISDIYKKGETVCEPNFCEDRFKECAEGIHFFIDRKEAENY